MSRKAVILILGFAVLLTLLNAFIVFYPRFMEESHSPEVIRYYTTSPEESRQESDEILTESQKEAFRQVGFRTDRFHEISTELKGGTK